MPNSEENRADIPTEQELRQLPRWALVAFAARCARRVQPLFKHAWPIVPGKHLSAIDGAISLAEALAANPASASDAYAATYAAADVARAAADAAGHSPNIVHPAVARSAARAAAHAADAAAAATTGHVRAGAAYVAANMAVDAAHTYAVFRIEVWRDFILLKNMFNLDRLNDATPVPPEFFGPLWSEREPEGWPTRQVGKVENPRKLVLQIAVPLEASDDEAIEAALNLAAAASRLHRAHGGAGLVISSANIYSEAAVPVGGES